MSSQKSNISEKQQLLLQIEELKKKIALTQDKINVLDKQEEIEIPVLELVVESDSIKIFDTEEDFNENVSKITSMSRKTTSRNENVKGFKRLMKRLNQRKQFNSIKESILSNDTAVSVFDEKENEIEISGFKTSKVKSEPLSKSKDKKSSSKSKNNKLSEKQKKNVSELFDGLKIFSKIQKSDSNKKSEIKEKSKSDNKKKEEKKEKDEKSISNLKIDELKEIAKSLKLKGFSKLKKQELIDLINLKKFCQIPLEVDVEKPKENDDKSEEKKVEKPKKKEQKEKSEEKPKKKEQKEKSEDKNKDKNEEKSIEKMTLVELKEVAKKMKISGVYKMKKEELLKNIKENC